MNKHQQHVRTASQGRKVLPPHARPTKPAPLKRGASYNNAHPQVSSPKSPSFNKTQWRRSVGGGPEEVQSAEEEESGMASFLQFCTTCERQIVTPGAVLYCSEACRRKDVSRPTSLQSLESVTSPSLVRNTSTYFEQASSDIVPQRSPTVVRPLSQTFSDHSLFDPNLSSDSSGESETRRDSDSAHYLDQFYSGFAAASEGQSRSGRPYMHRSSTTTDSYAIPSLVHSPSSSYGTVASNASYRPMINRHHPWNCNCSTSKSIDLVIPYPTAPSSPAQLLKDASLKSGASTETSFRVVEAGDISHEQRTPRGSRRSSERKMSADRSLKQLFSHDAMKASPK
ncbi:hypothetical protein DOTSEDRAFT_70985 [Dothistroma septosporum NZE10]|uniref:Uncharacterized protein n=1 Tax=Dothistroma septosporum (strain NZE10 / CBS 128990) TaxID=675120 RepID=N1PRY9_DOTSN|nr:hypothetical protein DOTSEDRAFT_70985 [Dothistroma septosporum NZE10]